MRTQMVLLCTALVLGACAGHDDQPPAVEAPPMKVRVTRAHRGEIRETLSVPGETVPLSVLRLAAPVAGRVTWLEAQPGDRLAAGAVAARILPLENEAGIRGFSLLEEAGALAPHERAPADQLRARLGRGEVSLVAPFAAAVSARLRNPGEQVVAGDGVLELFDPGSLYVVAQVPLERAAQLAPGAAAEIDLLGTTARGRVAAVSPAVTPSALTVPVRIVPDGPIRPAVSHASVQCRIETAVRADALLLPRDAVLAPAVGSSGTVLLLEGDRVRGHTVGLGLRTADEVQITSGLSAADTVVGGDVYAIPDGARVAPDFGRD